MNRTPKGMYVVAIVFFFMGLILIADVLTMIFHALGFERNRGLLFQPGYLWVVLCGLLLFWALCFGVVALVRERRGAKWLLLVMTIFLAVRFPHVLLLLPLAACWLYLLWLRLQASRRPTAP